MRIELSARSIDAVQRRLQQLIRQVPDLLGAALAAEAEIEMTEAKRRTPVDTGALRATGHVQEPRVSMGVVSVTMGFGGPAVDYALRVHEDMEMYHDTGQAKFLESVLLESAPHIAARVGRRVEARLGG